MVNEKEVDQGCKDLIGSLVTLRVKSGVGQAELSRLTGIAQPNLPRLEGGEVLPTLKTFMKICKALDITITLKRVPKK